MSLAVLILLSACGGPTGRTGATAKNPKPSGEIVFARKTKADSAAGIHAVVESLSEGAEVRISERPTRDPIEFLFPTWSPSGDRVAFARGDAVWMANLRNGNERMLAEIANAYIAVWSPDGRFLAVATRTAFRDKGNLYLVRVSTGAARLLATNVVAGPGSGVAWSPDGKWVYFQGSSRSGLGPPYRVDPGSGGLERLAEGQTANVTVSPDGRRLAFDRTLGEQGVYVLDLETGQERRIADSGHGPVWSPDGRRIAFLDRPASATSDEIFTVSPDGLSLTRVTNSPDNENGFDWSPDGRFLVTARIPPNFEFHTGAVAGDPVNLWIVAADGSWERRITDTGATNMFPDWRTHS